MTMPSQWQYEPGVLVPLAAATIVYTAGVTRLVVEQRWPRAGTARASAFAAGIGLLVVALVSPLDRWADALFSAHMAQHLIVMMVAPPLLVLGRPAVVSLWALPRRPRRAVAARWRRGTALGRIAGAVRNPLFAWAAASLALWFWHLPRPYAAAFDEAWIHVAEHLSFFFSAIAFWRVVVGDAQSRRLSLAATMLFVLTFAMQNGMLAAILTFAPKVLYAPHREAPTWAALTPLEDQQLAGILMWLVTGLIDLGVVAALFLAWMRSGERRTALVSTGD